jgi:hypothetical protein
MIICFQCMGEGAHYSEKEGIWSCDRELEAILDALFGPPD